MNALKTFERAALRLGYQAEGIEYDYAFDDFSMTGGSVRQAPMAVFSQTPASYRSAAFGVAKADGTQVEALVGEFRTLGAPLFFVIEQGSVSVWQVRGTGPARMLERTELGGIDALFERNKQAWTPISIQRAKSIGKFDPTYQLDFVDAGLMPAIEGYVHVKLDRLLNEVLLAIKSKPSIRLDDRQIFQGVFRLLAAKILVDRKHQAASQWNVNDVGSVLAGIGQYYCLSNEAAFAANVNAKLFSSAWEKLRSTFSVANISADDLAYVYENTLVTDATREAYSTHSTPRQVAELIATRLNLWDPANSDLKVYEPFTGAGVLLVAALRHMRGALPLDWNDRQRHEHLVAHLRGTEIDVFACEVATLSLILADYPNTNGWKIDNQDLFRVDALKRELKTADVVLCNPPFESLNQEECAEYPELAAVKGNKAEIVLRIALESQPKAIGFVLPRSFLMDKAYEWHRQTIQQRFSHIEIVSLPDGIFSASETESALIIARGAVSVGERQTIIASEVDDHNRKSFLSLGKVSRSRIEERIVNATPDGKLWLTKLSPVWSYLKGLPTLGSVVEIHWGLRWKDGKQSTASSSKRRQGNKRGLSKAQDHKQFALGAPKWLDVDPENLYGAGNLAWDKPKIICNAIRASRGAWRISAAVDRDKLRASQQFAVLWPTSTEVDLDALAAIINSPLANAFMSDFSADRRLRIKTFESLPLPKRIPDQLGELSRRYAELVNDVGRLPPPKGSGPRKDRRNPQSELPLQRTTISAAAELKNQAKLQDLLDTIDIVVMDAYDLPPRLSKQLLIAFSDQARPVKHDWDTWQVTESSPALTLGELKSDWVAKSKGNWPAKRLEPIKGIEKELSALLWE